MNLAGQLAQKDCRVTIAALEKGACALALEHNGLDVQVLDLPHPPRFAGSLWDKARAMARSRSYVNQYAPQLAEQLRSLSPQVIHWTGPVFTMVAPPAANQIGALPVWEVPNVIGKGSFSFGSRIIAHQCTKHKVLVLANSAYTANSLRGVRLSPQVFHLGVDENVFHPERVAPLHRQDLGIPVEAVVLGIVARLVTSKGQRVLLEALAGLQHHASNVHLLLLGDDDNGAYRRSLEDYSREHHLDARLHFAGASSEPERFYDAIDVAINAQIHPPEAFGLSVVEAMMMGRPVAVHALGGPAETVIDGVTGWHVPSPGVEAWQTGISRVLADRDRWQQMGEAARQHALANFTCEKQAERYINYVQAALASR